MSDNKLEGNSSSKFAEEGIDFKNILAKAFSAWRLILVSVIISVIVAFVINRYSSEVYSAKSSIMIASEDESNGMQSLMAVVGNFNPRLEFENQMVVLKSRAMTLRTLHKLDFEISYFAEGRIKKQEVLAIVHFLLKVVLKSKRFIQIQE